MDGSFSSRSSVSTAVKPIILLVLFATALSFLAALNLGCGGGGGGGSQQLASILPPQSDGTVRPSNLAYPTWISATVGQAITANIPTVTGTVNSYSVIPALPAGLSLNASSGIISGTPTAVTPMAAYTVTASNDGGSTTATVSIVVNKVFPALLELGHQVGMQLRFVNSRVLSADASGHWVLWNYDTAAILARGDQAGQPPPGTSSWLVDLAGPTAVVGISNGLEVRASSDGHLISTIALPTLNQQFLPTSQQAWWKLAADGSYVCAGTSSGLIVWDLTGQTLFSMSGNYLSAQAFAAAGEVRVALGPAGQNVIETISVPSGTSSVSPAFSGQFNSWFLDGERFLTNLTTTVWVYSKAGAQQSINSLLTVDNLTGQGNWFWSNGFISGGNYQLSIYPAAGGAAAATYTFTLLNYAVPSGPTIAISAPNSSTVSIVDLSGPTPSKTDYSIAVGSYAATSSTRWVTGNSYGVILDGAPLPATPRVLALGAAKVVGGTSRVAVATASGTIYYFDTASRALEGTISDLTSKLAMSSDGTVLAANSGGSPPGNIYALPSGALTTTFPYNMGSFPGYYLTDFTLSGSGTTLGIVLKGHVREVTPTAGGVTILSDSGSDRSAVPQLSPDGTLAALTTGSYQYGIINVYENGTLKSAFPGVAVGWIDNTRLLINIYTLPCPSCQLTFNAAIYNSAGTQVATAPSTFPALDRIQPVTSDLIYAPSINTIFSLSTWQATYTGVKGTGAISGPYVVYETGADSRVVVDTY